MIADVNLSLNNGGQMTIDKLTEGSWLGMMEVVKVTTRVKLGIN